jgi:hypothetical protein
MFTESSLKERELKAHRHQVAQCRNPTGSSTQINVQHHRLLPQHLQGEIEAQAQT